MMSYPSIEYFRMFFTDDILEAVVEHTFKFYIAERLCKSGKNLELKRGRPSFTIAEEHIEK